MLETVFISPYTVSLALVTDIASCSNDTAVPPSTDIIMAPIIKSVNGQWTIPYKLPPSTVIDTLDTSHIKSPTFIQQVLMMSAFKSLSEHEQRTSSSSIITTNRNVKMIYDAMTTACR